MSLQEAYAKLEGPRVSTGTTTQTSSENSNFFDAIAEAASVFVPMFLLKAQQQQRKTEMGESRAWMENLLKSMMGGGLGGQLPAQAPFSPPNFSLSTPGGIQGAIQNPLLGFLAQGWNMPNFNLPGKI